MRNLNECKAEIFRLSEKRIAERQKRVRNAISLSVPICLFLVLFSATALPQMISRESAGVIGDHAEGTDAGTEQIGGTMFGSADVTAPLGESTLAPTGQDVPGNSTIKDNLTPPNSAGNGNADATLGVTDTTKGPLLGGITPPTSDTKDFLDYGTSLNSFEFSLTWNTYGISSYDSESGKLVKSSDTSSPDAYVTTYRLTSEEKQKIFELIRRLGIASYPDTYDPHGGTLASDPSMTLILSVKTDKINKTVTARNIALTYTADNEKGQRFLNVCAEIKDILTSTDEWKALPEYEVFYD